MIMSIELLLNKSVTRIKCTKLRPDLLNAKLSERGSVNRQATDRAVLQYFK